MVLRLDGMRSPPPTVTDLLVQRDDGRFQIGISDDAAVCALGRDQVTSINDELGAPMHAAIDRRPAQGANVVKLPRKRKQPA